MKMKQKINKGEYGYRKSHQKKMILITVLLVLLVSVQIILSKTLHGSVSMLFTVTGILTVLPLANVMAPLIAMLSYRSPDQKEADTISGFLSKGTILFDLILTSKEKAMPIDYCLVRRDAVLAFSSSAKVKNDFIKDTITDFLKKNGIRPVVHVYSDLKDYIRALEILSAEEKKEPEENSRDSDPVIKICALLKSNSY